MVGKRRDARTVFAVAIVGVKPCFLVDLAFISHAAMLVAETAFSRQDCLALVVLIPELITALVMGMAKLGQLTPFLDSEVLAGFLFAGEVLHTMSLFLVANSIAFWATTDVSFAVGHVMWSRVGALGGLTDEACHTGHLLRLKVFVCS